MGVFNGTLSHNVTIVPIVLIIQMAESAVDLVIEHIHGKIVSKVEHTHMYKSRIDVQELGTRVCGKGGALIVHLKI